MSAALDRYTALLGDGNIRAFLHVIREGESSHDDSAYTVINGGSHFSAPPWRHPHDGIPTTQGGKASGAYRLLRTTWRDCAAALCLGEGLSSASQDGNIRASNRAAGMKSALRIKVGGVGLFRRIKASDIYRLLVDLNSRLKPPGFNRVDAHKSMPVVGISTALIFRVQRWRCFAQIGNGVVVRIPVNMIKVPARPNVVHVEPRQSVRSNLTSKNTNADVSERFDVSSDGPALYRRATVWRAPCEESSLRIVVQDFAQKFCGKMFGNHATSSGQVARAGIALARFLGPSILAGTA